MAGAMWERRRAEAGARRFSRCEYYYIFFLTVFSALKSSTSAASPPDAHTGDCRGAADPHGRSLDAVSVPIRGDPPASPLSPAGGGDSLILQVGRYDKKIYIQNTFRKKKKNHVTLLYVVVYCGRMADKGMADMQ